MRTPEQQIACYGCTEAEIAQIVIESRGLSSPSMIAMSMMSDAQEEIAAGMREQARQTLNRAKWIVRNYLSEHALAEAQRI